MLCPIKLKNTRWHLLVNLAIAELLRALALIMCDAYIKAKATEKDTPCQPQASMNERTHIHMYLAHTYAKTTPNPFWNISSYNYASKKHPLGNGLYMVYSLDT